MSEGYEREDYDHVDYEELEPRSSTRQRIYWTVLGVFAFFLALSIIFIPILGLPEYVEFDPLAKFDTLPPAAVAGRMILIGDVHGCCGELKELLQEAKYDPETDSVILLGDFISKGPNSTCVLNYAMEQNFSAVLGNHEISILAKYQNSKPVLFEDGEEYALNKPGNILTDSETRLARHLTPEQVEYLSSLPLVLDIGPVARGRGIAVHVGIEQFHSVEIQSFNDQLAMDRDWFKNFNDEMAELPKKERLVVYYGHHASMGLKLKKYTKGLDSSCVKGGQLSALILTAKGGEELIQVQCPAYIW